MTHAPKSPWKLLAAALLAGLAAAVSYLANELVNGEPDPLLPPVPAIEDPPQQYGWVNDPAAVTAVKSSLPCPEFRKTEAFETTYEGPDDVYLWNACRKVNGSLLPPRDQKRVGSCVGFGTATAVEHLMCVQIASGSAEEFHDLAPEVIYAGSRVQIGGGRINGDGSVGRPVRAAVRRCPPWFVPGTRSEDLRRTPLPRPRSAGRSRGVPAELIPVAKKHPVQAIASVKSWTEARAAVRNGYPIAVCSSQGFTRTRDADGFCQPSGVWMHCMALVGIRGGSRPGGFLVNSWGPTAHTGPGGPGSPSPAGFWADAAVLDRMLGEGDSWAFSGFAGFPARKLDWYARLSNDPNSPPIHTARRDP